MKDTCVRKQQTTVDDEVKTRELRFVMDELFIFKKIPPEEAETEDVP